MGVATDEQKKKIKQKKKGTCASNNGIQLSGVRNRVMILMYSL